ELSPEARTRRFKALPDDPQPLKNDGWMLMFTERIIAGAGDIAASLTPEERTLIEAKLRAMVDGPHSRKWRWLIFVSFFSAGGDRLAAEASPLPTEHLEAPMAPFVVGRLLLGIAARDPARVEPTMETVLAEASKRAPDKVVPLAVGAVGRLLVHGQPEGQNVA